MSDLPNMLIDFVAFQLSKWYKKSEEIPINIKMLEVKLFLSPEFYLYR